MCLERPVTSLIVMDQKGDNSQTQLMDDGRIVNPVFGIDKDEFFLPWWKKLVLSLTRWWRK